MFYLIRALYLPAGRELQLLEMSPSPVSRKVTVHSPGLGSRRRHLGDQMMGVCQAEPTSRLEQTNTFINIDKFLLNYRGALRRKTPGSKRIKSFRNIFLLSSEQMKRQGGRLIVKPSSRVEWQPPK